jgi:hypothetical protein
MRPLDKLVVYVPADAAPPVRAAMAEAGAGAIGHYDHCSFRAPGEGRFRPLEGADPAIGTIGTLEVVPEERLEVVLPRAASGQRSSGDEGRASLRGAGLRPRRAGRPGHRDDRHRTPRHAGEATTLAAFAEAVAAALPATVGGVRIAGDPDREVRRWPCAAVPGTSCSTPRRERRRRLRHLGPAPPPGVEFVEAGGPALVDVSHWAAEWTWLPGGQRQAAGRVGRYGGDPRQRDPHRSVDDAALTSTINSQEYR